MSILNYIHLICSAVGLNLGAVVGVSLILSSFLLMIWAFKLFKNKSCLMAVLVTLMLGQGMLTFWAQGKVTEFKRFKTPALNFYAQGEIR